MLSNVLILIALIIFAAAPAYAAVTAGRDQLGDFAPKFAEINDDVLFGQVWAREAELPAKIRSIVTVTSLMSMGITDSSIKFHLEHAKHNGVTRGEIAEIITHAAFYAGWPKAWAVFRIAKDVWGDESENKKSGNPVESFEQFSAKSIFPVGEPNDAYAKYFVGRSWLAPMNKDNVAAANVTFEPGCRNNWHTHRGGGQVLLVTAGRGWYQEEGKPARALKPGDTVNIPADVKHWHGAAGDSWFQHISLSVPAEGASTDWHEPVSDEEYAALHVGSSEPQQ